MGQTYLYFTNLLLLIFLFTGNISAQEEEDEKVQDSVDIQLKIRAGIDITGPIIYFAGKNILNTEGYISADINEKMALFVGAGYSDYKYSQYNYDYTSKGLFFKAGVDLNILKPEVAGGRYWAGLGIRYGISKFTSETPVFIHQDYWGTINSSLEPGKSWGHFIELSPGFRAELFRNFSIGWSISLRTLLYPRSKKDIRPLYIPGYGSGGESVSVGIGYFISWNIPFKKIRVPIKQEEPEEPLDEDELNEQEVNTRSQSLGGNRPATRFR